MNEGLHPQNWRLEVKRGEKQPDLGRDGLPQDQKDLEKQLEQAKSALERATLDRADLDDVPQLSENSQYKLEDFQLPDDTDKAYLDQEVIKAQEKVDRIQAKLEVAERLSQIKEIAVKIDGQISSFRSNISKLEELKAATVELVGEESPLTTGFDDEMTAIDDLIDELNAQKSNLAVYTVLSQANLKGEISDEDREQVRTILKNDGSLLDSSVLDRATRIAEKSKRSQIRDAQEFLEYQEKFKTLKGVERERLKRELVLLADSLKKAGVVVNDFDNLSDGDNEQIALMAGIVVENKPDKGEVKEEREDLPTDEQETVQESSLDLANFVELLNDIKVLAEDVRSKINGTDRVALENAINDLEVAYSNIEDEILLLPRDTAAEATDQFKATNASELIVEAKSKLAEMIKAETEDKPTVDADLDANAGEKNDGDASAKKPTTEADEPNNAADSEKKSRWPSWSGMKKALRKVWGIFATRDESENKDTSEKKDQSEAKVDNNQEIITSKSQMEKVLEFAETVLEQIDFNLKDETARNYSFKRFNKIDANLEYWAKLVDGEELSINDDERRVLRDRVDKIKNRVADQKRRLTLQNIKFT